MKRLSVQPRDNWQAIVEEQGLIWHTDPTSVYWDESACYEFTLSQIETIEDATEAVYQLYLEAGDKISADDRLMAQCGIPDMWHDAVRSEWKKQVAAIDYGRFDFGYNGTGQPKLFEFNCDTPTSMLEAAVVQWHWKEDVFPHCDQFNSLHEKLIARWQAILPQIPNKRAWFAHIADPSHEDTITTTYMRDLAMQAGCETYGVLMEQIGVDADGRFVDQDDQLISTIFKLYPWEWLIEEEFGPHILQHLSTTTWLEPVWKMMWSNKAVLAILWDMFPRHPNLLPATFDIQAAGQDYVAKPVLAREGANIAVVQNGQVIAQSDGQYGRSDLVYQSLYALPDFGQGDVKEGYPVIGSWIVNGDPAGMGIREDQLITGNRARFVPHIIRG
jgi:glutathionylspermidine synthase